MAKPAVAAVVTARAASRKPETVLFASPDDIGCAQIATAWFSLLADPRKATATLAAPRLPVRLDRHVVAAMHEVGGDLAAVKARSLTPALLAGADLVITMGDSFDRLLLKSDPPLYREHWLVNVGVGVGDVGMGEVDDKSRARSLRDLIRSRVAMLVFTEGWVRAGIPRDEARVTRPRWHSEAYPSF
ncbi:MAG: arsenate reductase ArsC [Polyangia bacterium]